MAIGDTSTAMESALDQPSWYAPQNLIQGLVTGVSLGILTTILQISFAAMIFTGDLSINILPAS